MRERLQTQLLSVLLLTLGTLLFTPIVGLASSGLPATVTMYPEAAGPGEIVEVTGLDFPAEVAVELQLTTSALRVLLPPVATAADGSFRELVTLPADAPEGTWELRATASGGALATYSFETSAGLAAATSAQGGAGTAAGSGNSISDIVVMLVVAGVLGALGIAGLFAWRQLRSDGSQSGMGTGDDLIWSGNETEQAPELTATDEPFWKTVKNET